MIEISELFHIILLSILFIFFICLLAYIMLNPQQPIKSDCNNTEFSFKTESDKQSTSTFLCIGNKKFILELKDITNN